MVLRSDHRTFQNCGRSKTAIAAYLMLTIALGSAGLPADDFSQFRGSAAGVTADQPIPLRWSESENIAWKIRLAGSGWSQPVIWQNRVYITAAVSSEDLRPKNFADGVKLPQSMGLGGFTSPPKVTIDWQVQCFDTATGQQIWAKTINSGRPKFATHPSNTFATESPVVDANGVVAFFGATGTVARLDHAGQVCWQKELGAFASDNGFGTGSSLAIYQDRVFVQHFTKGSSLVAGYDSQSGAEKWTYERKSKGSSWSSPLVWRNSQRAELLVAGGDEIDSLDPESGKVIWRLTGAKAPTACSLAADKDRIYFGASDPFSKGPLFAMSVGASGEISPAKKNGTFDHCDWLEAKSGPGMPSPVSDGQFVYVLDNNILRCHNAATGKREYQTRVPDMNQVAASPLVIGNKLLALDEGGVAVLVKAGKEFEVIGGGKLDDTFWATPAVCDGAIYFRGIDSLYCVRQSP